MSCTELLPAEESSTGTTDGTTTGGSSGEPDTTAAPGSSTEIGSAASSSGSPTTSSGGETTGTGTTTVSEESSTGPPPAREELLQTAGLTGCNIPLWCFEPGDVFTPAGGPIWVQECFSPMMSPPFELIEIEAVIQGLAPELTTVNIEVYRHDGLPSSGPGDLLTTQPIDSAALVLGPNTIAVEPPILINEPDICIGFHAPEKGLASSLGVATDDDTELPGHSFARSEGMCEFMDWIEITTHPNTMTGNWCLTATIREF